MRGSFLNLMTQHEGVSDSLSHLLLNAVNNQVFVAIKACYSTVMFTVKLCQNKHCYFSKGGVPPHLQHWELLHGWRMLAGYYGLAEF